MWLERKADIADGKAPNGRGPGLPPFAFCVVLFFTIHLNSTTPQKGSTTPKEEEWGKHHHFKRGRDRAAPAPQGRESESTTQDGTSPPPLWAGDICLHPPLGPAAVSQSLWVGLHFSSSFPLVNILKVCMNFHEHADAWATNFTCASSKLCPSTRRWAPYCSSVPLFATAPHAKSKTFVRDVRGFIRCARPLTIVLSRGKYMCHILGRPMRALMTSPCTFVVYFLWLLMPLEHAGCFVPVVPSAVGVGVGVEIVAHTQERERESNGTPARFSFASPSPWSRAAVAVAAESPKTSPRAAHLQRFLHSCSHLQLSWSAARLLTHWVPWCRGQPRFPHSWLCAPSIWRTWIHLVCTTVPHVRVSNDRCLVCGECVQWPFASTASTGFIMYPRSHNNDTIPFWLGRSQRCCVQFWLRAAPRKDVLFTCVCIQPVTAEQYHARTWWLSCFLATSLRRTVSSLRHLFFQNWRAVSAAFHASQLAKALLYGVMLVMSARSWPKNKHLATCDVWLLDLVWSNGSGSSSVTSCTAGVCTELPCSSPRSFTSTSICLDRAGAPLLFPCQCTLLFCCFVTFHWPMADDFSVCWELLRCYAWDRWAGPVTTKSSPCVIPGTQCPPCWNKLLKRSPNCCSIPFEMLLPIAPPVACCVTYDTHAFDQQSNFDDWITQFLSFTIFLLLIGFGILSFPYFPQFPMLTPSITMRIGFSIFPTFPKISAHTPFISSWNFHCCQLFQVLQFWHHPSRRSRGVQFVQLFRHFQF